MKIFSQRHLVLCFNLVNKNNIVIKVNKFDEAETKVVIENILMNVEATKKNMGIIMKQLPKDVNRKIASKILSSLLK